jgi:cyclopropane fatty-acyl-phospholipid synthase-like methyltransferase
MQNKFIEKLLNQPRFYRLVQNLLAYGASDLVLNHIQTLRAKLSRAEHILDIGCGSKSWLWQAGAHPIGLDLTYSYCKAFHEKIEPAVMGSANGLPSGSFDEVWSIGMFHHLCDTLTQQALDEMLRVSSSNGHVVIFDAVLPVRAWQKPLAYVIRRADRGRFVRSQAGFEMLLPQRSHWSIERMAYSLTGLEIVICQFLKSP